MKTTAVIITATASFAVAACGSGAELTAHYTTTPPTTESGSAPLTFTAPTTMTIATAQTGAAVRCTNHGAGAGARIPSPGHGVASSADGTSSSATLHLNRRSDGSLTVSCTP
jgi:hypothetical protein